MKEDDDVCGLQVSGVTAAVSQQWFWYNSTVCDNNWGYEGQYSQNSGAYVRSSLLIWMV